jgi:glycosyltransferase involved in cell wall biosynthesis
MKDDLLTLSRCLHLGSKVIFIDKVPQKELPRMYSSASLFVLSSIVNEKGETEGLGVVLLEAMACGLPVIGSNVGGIPDIIKDGETGLLTRQKDPDDIAEKIIKLLSDEKLRDKVVENGLNLVKQNFSWEIISDKFLKIYHDVIKVNNLAGKL